MASGDRTTQLPAVNLADEVIVNRAGTTGRIAVGAIAAQLAQLVSASPTIASIAGLGTAAGRMLYTTAPETWDEAVLTAAGRALLDDADAPAQRATLGLGDFLTAAKQTTNWGTIDRAGLAWSTPSTTSDAPNSSANFVGLTLFVNPLYAVQIAWGFDYMGVAGATDSYSFVRARYDGVWTAWNRTRQTEAEINGLLDKRVRAWGSFNGYTPLSINGSRNVASIVRQSPGLYTANFLTPAPTAAYAVLFGGSHLASSGWSRYIEYAAKSTTGFNIHTGFRDIGGLSPADVNDVSFLVIQ